MTKIAEGMTIDPGKKGGICLFTDNWLKLLPLPYLDSEVDCGALMELLRNHLPLKIIIEQQVMYKGQGAKSSATTLRNYGRLLGVADVYLIEQPSAEVITPKPRDWQKLVIPDAKRGETKVASIAFCKETYPDVSLLRSPRCSTDCDGLSDALCMSHWYRHHLRPLQKAL